MKIDDLALGNENEGGDGVIEPELVDDRMFHPISNSELEKEGSLRYVRGSGWVRLRQRLGTQFRLG